MTDKQTTDVSTPVQHGHGHGGHGHDHNFAAANKEFFDKSPEYSEAYDSNPVYIDTVNKIATEMLKMHLFDQNTTRMMDFACGTGLASRVFLPHVKSLVGVDISQGMLTQFNKRADQLESGDKTKIRSVCIEIKGEEGELEKLGGEKFDIITCSMAFHHISDLPKMTRNLVSLLNKGGALIIADNSAAMAQHGHDHGHGHGHGHGHQEVNKDSSNDQNSKGAAATLDMSPEQFDQVVPHQQGFTKEAMKELFEGAGLVDFEMREEILRVKFSGNVEIVAFVAKGVKAE